MTNGTAGLQGKTALVTGAARGIGRAIALQLASRGAAVAINYKSSHAAAEALGNEIHDLGADCMLVPGDVANKDEASQVVQTVIDAWQRLDILINNASITRDKSQRKVESDEWADVISVNLNGTYFCTSAALPFMIRQNYGRIVNVSSYMGQTGSFGQVHYAEDKGGIVAFTKSLALEMARYNITVNALSPGFTCTEMLVDIPPSILDQIRTKIPLGRFADPEEVAKAAVFLAADADYITGQQINVNGGLAM
jgi:acetoacetyl-CoA reductase